MPTDPPLRLTERFTHLVTLEGEVVLVGDDETLALEPLMADVVREVDGRRTAVNIATSLADRHTPELIHFVLMILMSREGGHVIRACEGSVSPAAHEGAGSSTKASGNPVRALAALLRDAWEDREPSGWALLDADGIGQPLILTDDYLHPTLPGLVSATPQLLCSLGQRRVLVGPTVGEEPDVCLGCLQERLRLNLGGRTLLHGTQNPDTSIHVRRLDGTIPAEAFDALARLISEVRKDSAATTGQFLAYAWQDGSPTRHMIDRLPHCNSCGDPTLHPPGDAVELHSRQKVPGSGGGFRTVSPEETLRRYSPLIDPLTGPVRHVNKVPVNGTDLVHVYTASHARHYGTATLRSIRGDRRDPSGGKGRTDLDAHVSAVCESLERFSSVHRGNEPIRIARHSELGPAALEPNELLHFSESQYLDRVAWNAADPGGFQWVPEPYLDEAIEWSPARSLVTGETRLVPGASIYFGFDGEGTRFCKADSNGLAGGNCLEEAVFQGLLELVERDAVALWWYNRARVPEVDLITSTDPYVEAVTDLYSTLGRRMWVLDLITDIGIPSFAALSALESAAQQDIIFGFGAHLDADIALSRALTELNQMLPTVFRTPEERRGQLLPDFKDAIEWWESATIEEHPYLMPADTHASTRMTDYVAPDTTDLRDDVLECVRRVSDAGCDVLVHDLTRSDVGFVAVRTLAPGLRHFWRRLGPGRLYDVPRSLGWIDEKRTEQELNPVSIFV